MGQLSRVTLLSRLQSLQPVALFAPFPRPRSILGPRPIMHLGGTRTRRVWSTKRGCELGKLIPFYMHQLMLNRTHVSRKNPLIEACNKLHIKVPKSASLERFRAALSEHWYVIDSSALAPVSHEFFPRVFRFTSLSNRAPGTSTRRPTL
jgi:hypothetical protein